MNSINSLFQMADDFNQLINVLSKPAFDFPKYNVSKTEKGYEVSMALAGYDKSELSVKMSQGVIEISATPGKEKLEKADQKLLFRGIAMKPFKVKMAMPYGASVGSVKFDNGILSFEFGESTANVKELPIN